MSTTLGQRLQSITSVESIMKLAGVNKLNDEFSGLEGFMDDLDTSGIAEVLQRRRAKELEQAKEEAADAILVQLRFGKEKIEQLRTQLQQLRIQEVRTKKAIEDIAVAIAYGHETRNYVPLAVINTAGSAVAECNLKEAVISPEDYSRILTNIKKKKAVERQQKKEDVATKTTTKARTVSS